MVEPAAHTQQRAERFWNPVQPGSKGVGPSWDGTRCACALRPSVQRGLLPAWTLCSCLPPICWVTRPGQAPLWASVPSCVNRTIAPVSPSSEALFRTPIHTALRCRIPDLVFVMESGELSRICEMSLASQPSQQLHKRSAREHLLS